MGEMEGLKFINLKEDRKRGKWGEIDEEIF